MSSQCHPREQQILLKDPIGNFVSDDFSLCNMFANEFVKNFSQQSIMNVSVGSVEDSAFQLSIDAVSVLGELKLLPDSAAGPDCTSFILYKRLANVLTQPLSVIYNQSLTQDRIPASWKVAKIISLYKGKGGKDVSGSYPLVLLMSHLKSWSG